jgi:hypothetical protein
MYVQENTPHLCYKISWLIRDLMIKRLCHLSSPTSAIRRHAFWYKFTSVWEERTLNIKSRFTAKRQLMSIRLYGVINWQAAVLRHVTFRSETLFIVWIKLHTFRGDVYRETKGLVRVMLILSFPLLMREREVACEVRRAAIIVPFFGGFIPVVWFNASGN